MFEGLKIHFLSHNSFFLQFYVYMAQFVFFFCVFSKIVRYELNLTYFLAIYIFILNNLFFLLKKVNIYLFENKK